MQPYPRAPDLVWPGHLHGAGCLSARAMDTGFPTVVWRLCLRLGCALAQNLGCTLPLLAGVLGCVFACVRAPLVPRHSWLGCAVWVCVLGLGFRLRPATSGWGVGVCVCLCACPTCTPRTLAWVFGVGACAWARASAAPRHFWMGCWGVCVLLCALRSYPATPGWGVRCGWVGLGPGFGCAPPLLAGVLGCVCACVRALLVPRHTWLGCAAWLCVLELWFRLRPTTSGWGVAVCVCLCARSACSPPLLAAVCGVGGCVFGCSLPLLAGVLGCVCVCLLRLYPATPGWSLRRVCVYLGSGFGCAPPLPVGVFGCLCVHVRAPLVLATPGSGVRRGCVCLGLDFGCAPQLRAGMLGCGVFVNALR